MKFKAIVFTIMFLVNTHAYADEIRIGSWNIANLHHENNKSLRQDSVTRDEQDFSRLKDYAKEIDLDIIALQEIGSLRAATRIFPEAEYHLAISSRYKAGTEDLPHDQRDIYTAFAVKKSRFPQRPDFETLDALSIAHLSVARNNKPTNRKTRAGLILSLNIDGRTVKLLNVHLKSICHQNSLLPIYDENKLGTPVKSRFHCRTLNAQINILESWIEQQVFLDSSIIVLGDFNRRLNRFDDVPDKTDHAWEMINDGKPNNLILRKGPKGKNTKCWLPEHKLFYEEYIDFIIYDNKLDSHVTEDSIQKMALPFQDAEKYEGKNGQKLSDHCPVFATINASHIKLN